MLLEQFLETFIFKNTIVATANLGMAYSDFKHDMVPNSTWLITTKGKSTQNLA